MLLGWSLLEDGILRCRKRRGAGKGERESERGKAKEEVKRRGEEVGERRERGEGASYGG